MDPDNPHIDFYKSELYVFTKPYPESNIDYGENRICRLRLYRNLMCRNLIRGACRRVMTRGVV